MVHAAAASMVGLLLVHGGSALCFAPSAPMTGVRGGSSAHCENRLGAPVRARLRGGAALDTVRMADPGESGGGAPPAPMKEIPVLASANRGMMSSALTGAQPWINCSIRNMDGS